MKSSLISMMTVVATVKGSNSGAVDQLVTIMGDIVGWLQSLGMAGAAIAFAIGGIQHIFGGAEGLRKAKPWYVGAVIGAIVLLGASAISGFLGDKINFS